MFTLSAKSLAELKGVAPDIVTVVKTAIYISSVDFSVFDGVRTIKEQRKELAEGDSHTLYSLHLIQSDGKGHAVDLVPYVNKQLAWKWDPIYKVAYAVAKAAEKHEVKLRWGAVWDRTLDQLDTSSPESLKKEVGLYIERKKTQGKRIFLDGTHFQSAHRPN